MPCKGNQPDHCCYLAGERCPHSISDYTDEDGVFRRWACGLRARYRDWDLVLQSPEYQRDVAPTFDRLGINCRDWPEQQPTFKCPCFDEVSD